MNMIKKNKILASVIFSLIFMTILVGTSFAFNLGAWNIIGRVVSMQDLIDELNFLYNRLPKNCNDGDLLKINTITNSYECFSCPDNYYLVSRNGQWTCSKYLDFDSGAGCKLKYRIKTSTATSTWAETDWGTANDGNWVYGPPVFVSGNPATISTEIAVMCDEYTSMQYGYRFRGNRGPYWNNTIGSHYADRITDSGTYTWQSAGFTDPFSKSCNIKGGDGGCGIMVWEKSESGPIRCDTQIRYNGYVSYKPGGWGPGYSKTYAWSASANTNCNGPGCSIEMAIKCEDFTDCSNPNTKLAGGNSSYTVADCTAAGGTARNAPDICICEFNASSCPSGWSQYNNWSSSISQTCTDNSGSCTGTTSCSTGQHDWSDTALESCTYNALQTGKTNTCASTTCNATINSIGCQ